MFLKADTSFGLFLAIWFTVDIHILYLLPSHEMLKIATSNMLSRFVLVQSYRVVVKKILLANTVARNDR